MKSLLVFILASLIPSASLQPSDDPFDPVLFVNGLIPNIPELTNKLAKLSENPGNIDEFTLNAINEELKDISGKLRIWYSTSLLPDSFGSAVNLLSSQLTELRNETAKLASNPIDGLQNEVADLNAAIDQVMNVVNGLPTGF